MKIVTARAHPNIAFIKYWGNKDDQLRLPANSSISMNLDGLYTETTVRWDRSLLSDSLILNGTLAASEALYRVSSHLDALRSRFDIQYYAEVTSFNNFPTGAGIASSASAFAALTLAATVAADLELSTRQLSVLARLGSGSASRSIPSGYVEWHAGDSHENSYSETIAELDYWDLVDVIAIVNTEHKSVGSKQGHATAGSSDLQQARVRRAEDRLRVCKQAILDRDFTTFAEVVELDSNLMHAVMMTSRPPLFYWQPASLDIMEKVRMWRTDGLNVCYTLDAGPNVHCLCTRESVEEVVSRLNSCNVTDIRVASPGAGAYIVKETY